MSVDRDYKIRIAISTEGDPGKVADGMQDLGKKSAEASEGVKLLEFRGLEFRKLVGELDRVLPGVGTLLRAAFNPATLGLGATVILIEQVKEALSEYNKKLDEIGEAAAKADFAGSIAASIEVYRDAIAEQEKYLANLHEIEKGEHGVAVELNNQLQLIAAIEAARQQKAEADRTLALARLKEQEVSGSLNPTQAALARQRIEEQYNRDKRAAEERKFQEDQDARTAAAVEATNRQAALDKKAADAVQAFTEAKAKKDSATKAGEMATPEAIQSALDASDEAHKAVSTFNYRASKAVFGSLFLQTPEARQKEAAAAQSAATLQTLSELKRKATEAENTDLTQLAIAAAQAKKNADANAKAGTDAGAARDQEQIKHDATSGDKADTDQRSTSAESENTRIELMQRARTLQKSETDGKGLSRQEAAELLQLMRMLGEKFFEQGDNAVTKQQFQTEMAALRRLIESKGK